MANVSIRVEGLAEAQRLLAKVPEVLEQTMDAAGREIASEVLNTPGLRQYPPAPRNGPPYPYYIRGRGTQYSPSRNSMSSERLGTQFYSESKRYTITLGNRASYAERVIGVGQSARMKAIGWRTLFDVATEKMPQIVKIIDDWLTRALARL